MNNHRSPPAKQPSSSAPEPTVRRVKGSRNLSASISNIKATTLTGVKQDHLLIAFPQPYIQYLAPKPLRIRKIQPAITLMTSLPNTDMVVSKAVPKALGIYKPLPEIPHSGFESIAIQKPQPPLSSTRRATQAGEHTVEVALRPTPRHRPRMSGTVEAHHHSRLRPPQPAPGVLTRHLPEYRLHRAPSLEPRRQMGHDLGGMALPTAPRPQRNGWKKPRMSLFERQRLLLRNLSKRFRGVPKDPLPSSPTESSGFARPQERDLVLEKNALLQMEVFSLKEHIDLLERQESSTQRIDLKELLESERGKVKLLEAQLETLTQVPSVSDTVNAGYNHSSGTIYKAHRPLVSTEFALHAALPPPSEDSPLLFRQHPNSFSERSKQQGRQKFTLTSPSSENSTVEDAPIYELPAAPILESHTHHIMGNDDAGASGYTPVAEGIEIQFQLPEINRQSTGLHDLIARIGESSARINNGLSEIELEGRSSLVRSEMGQGENTMRQVSQPHGPSQNPSVQEEQYFCFWSPKD